MLKIDDLRISLKISLIVALLGAVAIGTLGYAAWRMTSTDAAYTDLITRVDHDTLLVSRAGTRVRGFLASSYELANSTTDAANAAVAADLKARQADYASYMAEAVQGLPEKADLIQAAEDKAQAAFTRCNVVNAASASSTSAAGVAASNAQLSTDCVPLINDAISTQTALSDNLEHYSEANAAAFTAQANSAITLMVVAVVIGLALSLAAALWIGIKGLASPIAQLKLVMDALARNDTAVHVPGIGRKDELGGMAGAVEVFKLSMIEAERLRAEQETMKQRAAADRRAGMLALASRFEASVGGVVTSVSSQATELEATAQSMADTSEETSRQSSTVAAASDQATRNVSMVASATEELSASVGEILQQVTSSNRMIHEAVDEATTANQQMQGLSEGVRKISEVVTLINNIASQTNLLALNATIEAARAGDAGKGFAVVASEVKTLATQTAKATEVISSQIAAIQDVTQISVQSIQHINERIARVADTATAIAAAVEEQGAATREIARNVAEAAKGTDEVSATIGGVSESAQQCGAAATQVLASAGDLSKNGEILRSQVAAFLAEVRAA